MLTDIDADLTSGGVTLQNVRGSEAIYSESLNQLLIRKVSVETLNGKPNAEGITRAEMGLIHLADAPAIERNKGDMEFAGNVYYRAPSRTDSSTDTLALNTEHILWDNKRDQFVSSNSVELLMMPGGKAPIRQLGSSLKAPRDLKTFKLFGGAVTTEMDGDPRSRHDALKDQFDAIAMQVENQMKQTARMKMPTTIEIPANAGTGNTAQPEIPSGHGTGYLPFKIHEVPPLQDNPPAPSERPQAGGR